MTSTILTHFPFPTVREKQKKVLGMMDSAIKSGYRLIFLEAPTGFGKTPVAITLARYLGSSHICTATKDLQSQYRRDFPYVVDVRGRSNFPCIVKEDMGLEESCNYGPCIKDESYDCSYKTRLTDYKVYDQGTVHELVKLDPYAERRYADKMRSKIKLVELDWRPCHYYHQKWIGGQATHTVYNYRFFLSDIFYAGATQKRKLLVLDEAHQLENEVGDFRSFTIRKNMLPFLKMHMPNGNIDDIETWLDFCLKLRERLFEFAEKAQGIIERSNQKVALEPYTEKNLIDALELDKNLTAVIEDIKGNKDNWIVSGIQRDSTNQPVKVTLMPLDVSGYFDTILDKGSVSLFMSATILSKDHLCKTTGLDPEKVKFIRVEDSDFPVKNRPIHLMNVAWLSAKTMNMSMPKIAQAVDNIMSIHSKEKGIIHTTSYSQLQFIRDNISKENANRLIETSSSLDRSKVLQKHYESEKQTVLISPSLHLGVDLKDDLSRFQVIVKVPFPDLTDKKIAAKKERDPMWYTWNTVLRLVQAYGRSVRSSDDYATTYILDGSASYLLRNAKDLMPRWF
ncbi:MAG: ATP-dependent DNA helicase, partial [Thermoproteota archaeon]|nr:ATP-dependent DNA helicase [Thermoproteota archaeon]